MDNSMVAAPFRKQQRLQDFDYARSGYYFITICVKDKRNILWDAKPVGAICNRPSYSTLGDIIAREMMTLSNTYDGLVVDKYVIMPNHIHMIIVVNHNDGQSHDRSEYNSPTVSRAIKLFKSSVTKQIGFSIWQKSFYDHIIRDETDYLTKCNYIDTNPARWLDDEYFC